VNRYKYRKTKRRPRMLMCSNVHTCLINVIALVVPSVFYYFGLEEPMNKFPDTNYIIAPELT